MKRILSLLLVLVMLFGFTACGVDHDVIDQAVNAAGSLLIENLDDTYIFPEESTPDEPDSAETESITEYGVYTTKEDVSLYLYTYSHLPENFITKKEARDLGWPGGSLEPYAPGKCIGGDHFGNYESILPDADGREYTECDIDTLGADSRGAKRIVFSNDGLIYYTEDHYETFTLLYGEE